MYLAIFSLNFMFSLFFPYHFFIFSAKFLRISNSKLFSYFSNILLHFRKYFRLFCISCYIFRNIIHFLLHFKNFREFYQFDYFWLKSKFINLIEIYHFDYFWLIEFYQFDTKIGILRFYAHLGGICSNQHATYLRFC